MSHPRVMMVWCSRGEGDRAGYNALIHVCARQSGIAPLDTTVCHTGGAGGVEVPPVLAPVPPNGRDSHLLPPFPQLRRRHRTSAATAPVDVAVGNRGGPMADTVVMLEVPINQKDE